MLVWAPELAQQHVEHVAAKAPVSSAGVALMLLRLAATA